MDDGDMPKKFQKILVRSFREIDLHHLQPLFISLEIRASIGQFVFMGRWIRMMGTCS